MRGQCVALLTLPVHAEPILIAGSVSTFAESIGTKFSPEDRDCLQRKFMGLSKVPESAFILQEDFKTLWLREHMRNGGVSTVLNIWNHDLCQPLLYDHPSCSWQHTRIAG